MRQTMFFLGALLVLAGPAGADQPRAADQARKGAERRQTRERVPTPPGYRSFDDDPEDSAPVPPGKSLHRPYKSWDLYVDESSDAVDPALERFDQALRYAELAVYDYAAAEFDEAVRLSGRAVAVFNAAQAHADAAAPLRMEAKPAEAMQHHREAIAGFRRYLAMVPEAYDRAEVERSIAREARRLEDLVVAEREAMAEDARRKLRVYEQRVEEIQLDELSESLKSTERLERERNEFLVRLPLENFRYNARVRRGLWIGGAVALSAGVPLLLFSIGNLVALPYHSQSDLGMTVSGSLLSGMGVAALVAALALAFSPQAGLVIVPMTPRGAKTSRLFIAPTAGGIVAVGTF